MCQKHLADSRVAWIAEQQNCPFSKPDLYIFWAHQKGLPHGPAYRELSAGLPQGLNTNSNKLHISSVPPVPYRQCPHPPGVFHRGLSQPGVRRGARLYTFENAHRAHKQVIMPIKGALVDQLCVQ